MDESLPVAALPAQMPLFPTDSVDDSVPLTLDQVQAVYDRIDWAFVPEILEKRRREYGKYGATVPISMCKALALPYLIGIPGLTELARRLAERESYRVACGFRAHPPTRAQLWHFQYAPIRGYKRRKRERKEEDSDKKTWFFDVVYHILIRATLVGKRLGCVLPCQGQSDAPKIEDGDWEVVTMGLLEYPHLQLHLTRRRHQHFPLVVRIFTRLTDGVQPDQAFVLQPPPWMGGNAKQLYPDMTSESRSVQQSTACSAIILSKDGRILLGKRKAGYRPGCFALPGGRWRPGETLDECIRREVFEETGLHVLSSQPASISFNRYEDDHPECWSIGAAVSHHEGEVSLREPERCAGWGWYSLDNLPQPIFRPSALILDHYRSGRFSAFTWNQIEDWIGSGKENSPDQLSPVQFSLPLEEVPE